MTFHKKILIKAILDYGHKVESILVSKHIFYGVLMESFSILNSKG